MTSPTSHLPPQNLNTHPKTSLHSHNTTQSYVAFSPTPHHSHITSQNLSPPNLKNTPKHNLSLSNPNLINYRTLSNTASPSYYITKSLTTQPTKHTTKPPTSHLPPQTHNTHQNISPHSHNTTRSTTTLLATYHHPISPKKSFITQPAKLIDTQLYQKQHHTHHTNKLAPPHKPIISQHIVTSLTSHLPPQNSQHPPKHLPVTLTT